MKKQAFLFLFSILFCFNACNKDDAPAVLVRVKNSALLNLKEVHTNSSIFENIQPSETTSYQSFDNAIKAPIAMLITNNDDTDLQVYITVMH